MAGERKIRRAKRIYEGFKGSETMAAVFGQIPDDLIQELTAKQIAAVAELINKAYHKERASTGAEMVEDNAVYVLTASGKLLSGKKRGQSMSGWKRKRRTGVPS